MISDCCLRVGWLFVCLCVPCMSVALLEMQKMLLGFGLTCEMYVRTRVCNALDKH